LLEIANAPGAGQGLVREDLAPVSWAKRAGARKAMAARYFDRITISSMIMTEGIEMSDEYTGICINGCTRCFRP
jgi:hypothetical protein